MFFVFIDTQAFERAGFGFSDAANLIALANAVEDGHVTVLVTEVTDREVKAHIADRVAKALAAVKKEYVLQILTVVDFDAWRRLDAGAAVQDALNEWERYKEDIKVKFITVDLAKPTIVMDAFFDLKPPFSAKKRTEFRDAFVLEALRSWARQEDQQVIVVSGDPDHQHACDGTRLVHAETIDEALARTLDDAALVEAARARIAEQLDLVGERVAERLRELPVSIEEDWDADIEGVEVSEFNLDPTDFDLVEVRNNSALLSGTVSVTVEVFATVADYDNGSRDEGDWVFLPYNSLAFSTTLEARLAIRIPFENQVPLELGDIDPDLTVEEPNAIDIDHEWERVVRREWFEDEPPDEDVPNVGGPAVATPQGALQAQVATPGTSSSNRGDNE